MCRLNRFGRRARIHRRGSGPIASSGEVLDPAALGSSLLQTGTKSYRYQATEAERANPS
ncbi:hypothetical protein ACFU98_36840 [Streptomyces sp. NPDC057575]|uniref:hypothetical protein n=1 Tax=unclassified Streptomyces TaxID=2593676 RepID=UPI0036948AB7